MSIIERNVSRISDRILCKTKVRTLYGVRQNVRSFYMAYSEALPAFDRNAAIRPAYDGRNSADSTSKEPINFSEIFREYSESADNSEVSHGSTFFTGASVDMFGAVPFMSTPAFPEELDAFSEHEDLDSAISFDEISTLDDITDTEAAKIAMEKANDRFSGFDELSDAMTDDADAGEDLDMFSDFEEII